MTTDGNELIVLLGSEVMGLLRRQSDRKKGGLEFQYNPEWLKQPYPIPLSLSMPVQHDPYRGATLENWLWGLLPDDPATIRRWASIEHVHPGDVFGLLSHRGEDVAGAVQFVRPERVESLILQDDVRWLSDAEMADRLQRLAADAGTARLTSDPGRFSLAGAQPKMALLYENGRWGVPSGRIPTNTIVKLAPDRYEGVVVNEHFCMRLALRLGVLAAITHVINYGGVKAIAVTRYDRISDGTTVRRVHQEDMCQALGIHPNHRYQSDGGPGVREIFGVLENCSDVVADTERFFRAQVFNFLVGGTDAHGKNFSVLLMSEGAMFAPLYDVASMWPYSTDRRRIKLAMRIGRRYEFEYTLPRHWVALADDSPYVNDPISVLQDYATRLPDLADSVAAECIAEGVGHPILQPLVNGIRTMCEGTLRNLAQFEQVATAEEGIALR